MPTALACSKSARAFVNSPSLNASTPASKSERPAGSVFAIKPLVATTSSVKNVINIERRKRHSGNTVLCTMPTPENVRRGFGKVRSITRDEGIRRCGGALQSVETRVRETRGVQGDLAAPAVRVSRSAHAACSVRGLPGHARPQTGLPRALFHVPHGHG